MMISTEFREDMKLRQINNVVVCSFGNNVSVGLNCSGMDFVGNGSTISEAIIILRENIRLGSAYLNSRQHAVKFSHQNWEIAKLLLSENKDFMAGKNSKVVAALNNDIVILERINS